MLFFSESKTASFGRCLHEPHRLLIILVCCIYAYMFYTFFPFLSFSLFPFYITFFLFFSFVLSDECGLWRWTKLDVGGIMMPRGKCTIWLLCND
ncbi:hypothetical protein ASPBRDRAFT_294044 [Aspergillus brasiliensis CBS 101740]|uniref:Uncharacterized protein n=1 Tax=Aspergillus brasiliensis (strain CBS 101740 / IMI 381727 / IBT 21946) TaxID=767769 RepID=A0A1L9UBV7_ASPBC|nr:hypothetical protein ASPBRDRAFT_294044 [Aspergillus brasiliensis CBS 101740]